MFGSGADAAAAAAAAALPATALGAGGAAAVAAAARGGVGLDPRDAGTVALLGDAALALALVASALSAGGGSGAAALAAALEAGPLPASMAPPEARARLLQALRGASGGGGGGGHVDLREVKDALRSGLQAQRATSGMMTGSGSGSRG